MTIKIYGLPMSTCTGRVLATLFEKQVTDYEIVPVDLSKGEHKKPEFLALQPFGVIPVLQDGAVSLFDASEFGQVLGDVLNVVDESVDVGIAAFDESRAIARYVEYKFEKQGTPLFGSSLEDRAAVEQWLEVESQNYNPQISTLVFELVFKSMFGGKTDPAVVEAKLEKLEKVLDIYEAHLAKSKYLAGDFFSLADLSHIPYTHYLINVAKKSEIYEKRSHVKAWWEDISSRPAWKKVEELIGAA